MNDEIGFSNYKLVFLSFLSLSMTFFKKSLSELESETSSGKLEVSAFLGELEALALVGELLTRVELEVLVTLITVDWKFWSP